ncbi:MAG: peptide deformylase [Elusimicrobiota bacterium]
MAVLRITKHGEKVLKTVSLPVDYESMKPKLPGLLRDMWATMRKANGVGLAAPQIGINTRIAVIDVHPDGKSRKLVLINPQIVETSGELHEEEGCLSVPGVYAKVVRAAKVRIRAIDARGESYEMSGEGLLARAFQHEIDHLDGKLFLDRLPFSDKLKVLAIVKDVKKNWS